MEMMEIDCGEVVLSGLLLHCTISLHNPHQLLAVIFELEASPQFLQIEPRRGMIMQGETKVVKLRCRSEARSSLESLEKEEKRVTIRGSYFSEYNKKIMARSNLKGWSTISKQIEERVLPVHFSLRRELQRAREESHKSSSLRNSRKMNSFQKFKESSLKKGKDKLHEDLDFIFRNQQFKKMYDSKLSKSQEHNPNTNPNNKSNTSPHFFQNYQSPQKQVKISSKPLVRVGEEQRNPRVGEGGPEWNNKSVSIGEVVQKANDAKYSKSSRGLELIILAVIAAVFLGLGEGVGRALRG